MTFLKIRWGRISPDKIVQKTALNFKIFPKLILKDKFIIFYLMASQNINPDSVTNGKANQDEANGNRGSAVAKR